MDFGVADEDEAPAQGLMDIDIPKAIKSPEPMDVLEELYEPIKTGGDGLELLDVFGDNAAKNLGKNGWKPAEELDPMGKYDAPKTEPNGLTTGFGLLNGIRDTYKAWSGNQELDEGIAEGNADKSLEGTHDLLEGGSGVLANLDNQVGALAKSFGMGFSFGDAIAPSVFGGSNDSVKDKNGQYYGHTGNGAIDDMIDGGHELSNGDYTEGAKDAALGAWDATEAIVETGMNPASLLTHVSTEGAIDLAAKGYEAESSFLNPFSGAEKIGEGIGDLLKRGD